MKKKILSMLCAVTMLISSFACISASAAGNPLVEGEVTAPVTDGKLAKGADIYVNYYIKDLEGLVEYHTVEDDDFNEFPVVTGISMFQIFLNWDSSKLAYRTDSSNVFGASPTVDTTAGTFSMAFNTTTKTAMITDISKPVITLHFKAKSELTEDVSVLFATTDETIVRVASYDEKNTSGTVTDYRTGSKTLDVKDTVIKIAADAPVVPDEPQITISNKYVFNFTADAGEEVMVKLTRTNGIESDLTYSLPELVKGEASIFGLLKVTDDTVVSGDKFDISVVDADRNPVKAITTITVE